MKQISAMIFVVVCGATFTFGAIYFSKTKSEKCEDCTFFKEQTKQLINALLDVRKDVKGMAENSSYIMDEQPIIFMYASLDSVPKRKKQLTQVQMKAGVALSKIDSALFKTLQQIKMQQNKN